MIISTSCKCLCGLRTEVFVLCLLVVFLDGELQSYERYVLTRPVFETGVKIRTFDDFVWTVSGTMDNVLENGETLQQDVYRGGFSMPLRIAM